MAHARGVITPRLALVAAAAALAGCGGPAPESPPKTPPPRAAIPRAEVADLTTGPLGEYRSERFDVRLPLPDGPGWKVEDGASPWLEAAHEGSSARLLVRTWREADITSRALCEAKARLWRSLPRREDADIIERRHVATPRGFDTLAEVGVLTGRARDGAITGFVMAFGGWAHRCFAYVLTTSATGKGAEQAVASRLATMMELSLANVALEPETAPSLPRDPPP